MLGLFILTLSLGISGYAIDTKIDTSSIKQGQQAAQDAIRDAQNSIKQSNDSIKETKNQIEKIKNANAISRCETITTKIEEQVTRYSKNKDPRIESYQNIVNKTTDLVTKLKGKGIDTTHLSSNLVVLDSKIKNFANSYDGYISSISSTKEYTCNKSEGEFRSSLQASRDQLRQVKDKSVDIQDYIKRTIRPEVQKIRDQLKK